jgi:hypothetical protein
MRERERRDEMAMTESGPDSSSDSKLREIRSAGETLLAAGADAIAKALSGNSVLFLNSTRQQGGQ